MAGIKQNGELNIMPLTGSALLAQLEASKNFLDQDLKANKFNGIDRDKAVEQYLKLGEQIAELKKL